MQKTIPSQLKITFLIFALVCVVFGLLWLFIPQAWSSLSGRRMEAHELYRLLGAGLLALGISSWLAQRATHWESVRIVVISIIVGCALAAGIFWYYLFIWGFPALYFLPAFLMTGFTAVFTYFYFKLK